MPECANENEVTPPSPASGLDALRASASEAVRRAHERREAKLAEKQGKPRPVTSQARAAWRRFCLVQHGHECAKGVDMAKLSSYAHRYDKAGRGDFMLYMKWCLENWSILVHERFKWLDRIPLSPSIPVFVRFSDKFEDAYLAKQRLEERASMSERDRLIALNRDKGMTQEAAERSADERMGVAQTLEKTQRTLKEIKRERLVLALAAKTAPKPLSEVYPPKLPLKQVSKKAKAKKSVMDFGEWED